RPQGRARGREIHEIAAGNQHDEDRDDGESIHRRTVSPRGHAAILVILQMDVPKRNEAIPLRLAAPHLYAETAEIDRGVEDGAEGREDRGGPGPWRQLHIPVSAQRRGPKVMLLELRHFIGL